jgi:UDP-glucose 4-epimerase
MLACNVTGARNLLKYAHRADARRLIFASTLSVHGRVDEPVVTETTPVRGPDIYGASKHLAERLFAEASDWLPCVALRLPGVLGAGAHRAWIPTLLDRVRRHEPVTAYSLGSMFNNAVHVHDLNDLMLKLLAGRWSGFHAFPLGAAGTISIADLVKLLITLTGSRSTVAPGSAQKTPFLVSSDYAVRTFDYRPMDIEAMLRRYVSESAPEA